MNPEDIKWSAWTRTMEHYLRLKTFYQNFEPEFPKRYKEVGSEVGVPS